MAIKGLKKTIKATSVETKQNIDKFISKGGSLSQNMPVDEDHRLTLRIPKWLIEKIDIKRKGRVGKISRNLWILEALEKMTK